MKCSDIKALDGTRISTKVFENVKKSPDVVGVKLLGVITSSYLKREYEYKISLSDDSSINIIEI